MRSNGRRLKPSEESNGPEGYDEEEKDMNDVMRYGLYFVLGGFLVSVSTYFGSQGRSFLAAFASTFPAITGATFLLIYLNSGSDNVVIYAKDLLWFIAPWILYVTAMILAVPRVGFWSAMGLSLALFMGSVGILRVTLR